MIKYFTVILVILLSFSNTLTAGDAGFNVASRAKTLSLNGLYFAGTDGLQAVLTNPSMLSLLKSGGVEFFAADRIAQFELESTRNGLFKSFDDNDFSFGGGIYWMFSQSFSAALSYQRAVDYKTNWPFSNLFRNDSLSALLVFDFHNQITIDAASASLAINIDKFSIGASANLYHVEHHSAFPFTNERWGEGLGRPAYQLNYDQDGYTFGFGLGVSAQFNDRFRAGVMARSGYKADMEGIANNIMFAELDSISSQASLTGTFEMPWVFGGGIVYEWSENLTLNMDIQYSLWGNIRETFILSVDNSIWQQRLSMTDTLTDINASGFNLSFTNTIDAGIGLEYKTSDLVLRTGYRFSQSPNSDDSYNLLFPDVDQHWVSLGIGYLYENLLVDASIAYAFGVSREIIKPGIGNLSGKYKSNIILPTVTIRYLL